MVVADVSQETLEFLLDLPEGVSVVGIEYADGVVRLSLTSELFDESVDRVELQYAADDYGNVGLRGISPA